MQPFKPQPTSQRPPNRGPRPVTLEQQMAEVLKRLGRMEKHLIDIREMLASDPGQPRYVIERNPF